MKAMSGWVAFIALTEAGNAVEPDFATFGSCFSASERSLFLPGRRATSARLRKTGRPSSETVFKRRRNGARFLVAG